VDNPFDRLARALIDTGAATTAKMLRTGRHATAVGPGVDVPPHLRPPTEGDDGDATPPPFENPMEAAGSLVVGGESGAAEELPAGTEGQVLVMVAGTPTWVDGSTISGGAWSVLTNGEPADPQLIFTAEGDVIMVEIDR